LVQHRQISRYLRSAFVGLALAIPVHGCGPKQVPKADANQIVDELRGRSLPRSLQARFQIRVGTNGQSGSTTGAIITHMPDKFRLEILTPLGTPMVSVASNGSAIHAWSQQQSTFFRGDDAFAVLEELTGGAVTMADVLQLLTGGLPLPDAPVLATQSAEEGVWFVLGGPRDVRIRALVHPKKKLVRRVEIGRASSSDSPDIVDLVAIFDVSDYMRLGGSLYPEEMTIDIPPVGWTLELTFHTWDELGQIPDVFDLPVPAGATVADLEQTLRDAAESKKATQPPG
jgi:outer membrane biogenesis lipoprotein LolB